MSLRKGFTYSAAVISLCFAALPASAQLGEIIDGIGFGKEKEPIEYRERAPLVVPPSFNLRPPEEKSPGSRAANWPQDPDIAKAKAKADDDRRPRATSNETGGPKLSVDELRAGRIPGAGVPEAKGEFNAAKPDSRGWVNPDIIRSQGQSFRGNLEPSLPPGEEPKRKYLTDPPKGIRSAAKNAPFVATKDKNNPTLDEESSPYSFINPKKQED